MEFLRRVKLEDFIADQEVAFSLSGEAEDVSQTLQDIPKKPAEALEVEIEGRRYILLAYQSKQYTESS